MVDRYILDKVPVKKHQFLYYIHVRLYVPYRAMTIIVLLIALPILYYIHIFMMAQVSNLILHNKNHYKKESSAPRGNLTFLDWGDVHRVVFIL